MSKKVVISCIPKLNDIQQNGMLQLLQDLESLGCKAYLWTDFDYSALSSYKLKTSKPTLIDKTLDKLKKAFSTQSAPLAIDQDKWIQRLQRWAGFEDDNRALRMYDSYVHKAVQVFGDNKPDYFFCWNPFCCHYGIANDVAEVFNIKTGGIEWGYLPNTFLLDKDGTLAKSYLFNNNTLDNFTAPDLNLFEQEGQEIFNQLQTQSLSIYTQAKVEIPEECLKDDATRPKILVLAIDEIDAGAYPATHPEREGLLPFHKSSVDQATRVATANDSYRVIFKPHPSHNLYPQNQQLTHNSWVVNGNPDQLIEWADVIFCAGSKMEFSALLKNKPLITFGAGLLYGKGCSYEISDTNQLNTVITTAIEKGLTTNLLTAFKQFLGYLKSDYLYSFNDSTNTNRLEVVKRCLK
jgi:hypothetical protein